LAVCLLRNKEGHRGYLKHREQFIQQYEQRDVAGTSVRNVVGKFLWEVIGGSNYDAMRPGIVRAFLGEEVTCELNLRRHMDRHFYCKFVPERNNVSVIGIFIMLLDITARKTMAISHRLVEMQGEHFEPRVADRGKEPCLK